MDGILRWYSQILYRWWYSFRKLSDRSHPSTCDSTQHASERSLLLDACNRLQLSAKSEAYSPLQLCIRIVAELPDTRSKSVVDCANHCCRHHHQIPGSRQGLLPRKLLQLLHLQSVALVVKATLACLGLQKNGWQSSDTGSTCNPAHPISQFLIGQITAMVIADATPEATKRSACNVYTAVSR